MEQLSDSHVEYTDITGGAPPRPPSAMPIWQGAGAGNRHPGRDLAGAWQ
jgi:hypothetical protein